MPRLPYALIRRARQAHPLLPLVLRACRDLQSARNELRWLVEFAEKHYSSDRASHLLQLCRQRAVGKPLQYILGDQPFGDLQILCRPGVLIPRLETENHTTYLAELLIRNKSAIKLFGENGRPRELRILDLCTGTGCIALLLHRLLSPQFPLLRVRAYDIEARALALAKRNLESNIRHGSLDPRAAREVEFCYGDVRRGLNNLHGGWDIVVSNPPYISPASFLKETSRSVRNFEPRLALVPQDGVCNRGDQFNTVIAGIALKVGAQALVIEGDGSSHFAQEALAPQHGKSSWTAREIWKDDLSNVSGKGPIVGEKEYGSLRYKVVGVGHDRADVLLRGDGSSWLSRL